MTSSYYLWKWADNDLPAQPDEVFSELLHGRLHSALQPFDARPVLNSLQTTESTRHALGEEWDWQIQPADTADRAHFIFLQCPAMFPHEGLRFGDTLRIFQAFLRGEPRPAQYSWRSIRQELEQANTTLMKGDIP